MMEYNSLVNVYEELITTTKRLEKTEYLSNFLRKIPTNEITDILYLLQGKVFPDWDERKIGVSSQLIIKSIMLATGESKSKVINLWKKTGDLGKVAEQLILNKKQKTLYHEKLTIKKVIKNLQQLASLEGKGTVQRKVNIIAELLGNASPKEALYITRTILEELRIGAASGTLRDSISKAYNVDVEDVKDSYNLLVDYSKVAYLASKNKLKTASLEPGNPFKSMLALREDSFEDIFKALGKPVQFEYKLDGVRCQIHKKGKEIKLFTRRLEEITKQFKEILPLINKHIEGNNFILDVELVGYHPKTKHYLPFQNISQRIKRKYNIEEIAKKFPVEINVFDIVYYKNKLLFQEPLSERRKLLEKIIKQKKKKIVLTKKKITASKKIAEKFYHESLSVGMEGVMAKKIDSKYKPGRYVKGWIKLKPVLETLDLVIVKSDWGEGKRSKWLSSYTIACRHNDKFLELGKVSSGVKEKDAPLTYFLLTKYLKPLIIAQKDKQVTVKPKIILEVAYEEIQKSPTYSSGFALRFPRVINIREDKPLLELDTLQKIKKIYEKQKIIINNKNVYKG